MTRREWVEILPQSQLEGDSQNPFAVTSDERFTHLRFKIFPDGGVARLRVYGDVVPDWDAISARGGLVDLAAVENGGLVVATSATSSSATATTSSCPAAPRTWATAGRRSDGAAPATTGAYTARRARRLFDASKLTPRTSRVTSPRAVRSKSARGRRTARGPAESFNESDWRELLPRTQLQAHTRHFFEEELRDAGRVTHVRFRIYPDGGVSRLRLYGSLTDVA